MSGNGRAGTALHLDALDETRLTGLASDLSSVVTAPSVIYLQGSLGAGKTTFIRAFIHALGYRGKVKSPSYGLLETYTVGNAEVIHVDLYRLADPEEVDFLGITDLLGDATILLVEWPEKGAGRIPPADVVITLEDCGADSRQVGLHFAPGAVANGLLDRCQNIHASFSN